MYGKLTDPAQFLIVYLVLEKPEIYLRSELLSQLGLDITKNAICKFLHKAGLTRQMLKTYAIQTEEALCSKFSADVSFYREEMLIFLDETETDCQDTFRKKGYSLRGKPTRSQKLLVRGDHVSVICLISIEGILCCRIVRGSVNNDTFLDFVENILMPNFMPFDGYSPSHYGQLFCSSH